MRDLIQSTPKPFSFCAWINIFHSYPEVVELLVTVRLTDSWVFSAVLLAMICSTSWVSFQFLAGTFTSSSLLITALYFYCFSSSRKFIQLLSWSGYCIHSLLHRNLQSLFSLAGFYHSVAWVPSDMQRWKTIRSAIQVRIIRPLASSWRK